ncbi:hypothetical protein [Pontibacterium sp.]|uniref:hypothetical protein n=1 Tax=Pontibacterium sp. TaxID=2036026 RepID=UPI003566509E
MFDEIGRYESFRFINSLPEVTLDHPDGFVAGPAPRGGWPIKPYSVSKYIPHQGSKEKARRQRHMGIFEFQNAA